MISFLQPCLLMMLHRGAVHGYSLLSGLDVFCFRSSQNDPSLLYRILREMEEVGLVTSEWDSESLGPQRRVYQINPDGDKYLKGWIKDLRQTCQEIDTLIAAYEKVESESD